MAQGQPQLDLVTTAQPRRQAELWAGAGHPAATMKCSLQPDLGAELLLNTRTHRGAPPQDAPAAKSPPLSFQVWSVSAAICVQVHIKTTGKLQPTTQKPISSQRTEQDNG